MRFAFEARLSQPTRHRPVATKFFSALLCMGVFPLVGKSAGIAESTIGARCNVSLSWWQLDGDNSVESINTVHSLMGVPNVHATHNMDLGP